MTPETWEESQASEISFWRDCSNTYGEETKQLLYLHRMGYIPYHDGLSPFNFHGEGLTIVDIGGGPCSVLLKFTGAVRRVVVDPCPYPDWVRDRYVRSGIEVLTCTGEDFNRTGFDVCLMYNVLQHVQDPEKIIHNALKSAKALHIFEWIDIPAHQGHPHCLTQESLERWVGRKGLIEHLNGANECYGKAWFI